MGIFWELYNHIINKIQELRKIANICDSKKKLRALAYNLNLSSLFYISEPTDRTGYWFPMMNYNNKWIIQEPVSIYFSASAQGTKDNLDLPRHVGHSVWTDIDTQRTKK